MPFVRVGGDVASHEPGHIRENRECDDERRDRPQHRRTRVGAVLIIGGILVRSGDDVEQQTAEVIRAHVQRGKQHQVHERVAGVQIGARPGNGNRKLRVGKAPKRVSRLIDRPACVSQRGFDLDARESPPERRLDEIRELVRNGRHGGRVLLPLPWPAPGRRSARRSGGAPRAREQSAVSRPRTTRHRARRRACSRRHDTPPRA